MEPNLVPETDQIVLLAQLPLYFPVCISPRASRASQTQMSGILRQILEEIVDTCLTLFDCFTKCDALVSLLNLKIESLHFEEGGFEGSEFSDELKILLRGTFTIL